MLYDIFMDFYIYFIVVFRQVKCFINNFDIFYNLDDIYMKYIFGIQNWDVYKDLYYVYRFGYLVVMCRNFDLIIILVMV